jgi:hypothetical protein
MIFSFKQKCHSNAKQMFFEWVLYIFFDFVTHYTTKANNFFFVLVVFAITNQSSAKVEIIFLGTNGQIKLSKFWIINLSFKCGDDMIVEGFSVSSSCNNQKMVDL